MKFINRDGLAEFIDDDNRLVAWGGRDTWQYAWQPELRPLLTNGAAVAAAAADATSMVEVVPSSFLIFSKNVQGDYSAPLEIKNVGSAPVVYKVSYKTNAKGYLGR